jgi:hypothetical protein
MSAGEVAGLPAIALRAAPVELSGGGIGGPAPLAEVAAAFASLCQQAAAGEISISVAAVPLADVEQAWRQAGNGQRVVFVP